MSLQTIRERLCFGCKGSLIDNIGKKIPNYIRSSSLWLEDEVDGRMILYPTEAYTPAFKGTAMGIYLEPSGSNKVLFNNSLENPRWIKGSNITISSNAVVSPTGARDADRLLWGGGQGNSQLMSTKIRLTSGRKHCLSIIVKANTDNFGIEDKILIFGNNLTENIGEGEVISLVELNGKVGQWVKLSTVFTPRGLNPDNASFIPTIENSNDGTYPYFGITNFTSNTIQLFSANSGAIPSNSLIGSQLIVSKNDGDLRFYISANSGFDLVNRTISLTIDPLYSSDTGSLNISDNGIIANPEHENLSFGIYVENINSLDIGGIQIEERDFSTSMIFQSGETYSKSATFLEYEHCPVREFRNWSFFLDVNEWFGSGNILDMGSLSCRIENNNLIFSGLDFTPVSLIGKWNFKLLLDLDNINDEARLYLDQILIQRVPLTGEFVFRQNDPLILTTEGVRVYNEYLFFNNNIGSALDSLGNLVGGDIEITFNEISILPLDAINYSAPTLVLPLTIVPPRIREKYIIPVGGLNLANNTVVTNYASGINLINAILGGNPAINTPEPVTLQRKSIDQELITIGYANALSIALNVDQYVITLDSTKGLKIGDILVFRDELIVGKASVRFPVTSIDAQAIKTINTETKTVILDSTSSFILGRAIISSPQGQDKGELLIKEINLINRSLVLSMVDGLEVGDIISQPRYETLINPHNYYVTLLDEVSGVKIEGTFSNGIIFSNENDFAVKIDPRIRIYL